MKRRNPPITLSTLPARTIYHATLQFTQRHPRPHTKGRKPLSTLKPSSSPSPYCAPPDAPRIATCSFASPPKPCPTSPCPFWVPCCTAWRPSPTNAGTRC